MNYKIDHIPKSGHKRPGTKITATSITIHSTANEKSTAKNERDNLAREGNTRAASFHIVVDDKEAIECIPLDEITYHAGNREGNNTSISIEMCESGDRAKTLQNAVEVATNILHEKGWGIDKLKRHYDWSKKNCPRILSANNWEGWTAFKLQVERKLNDMNSKELDTIKISLHGKEIEVEGIIKDLEGKGNKTQFIPIRFLEKLGLELGWDNKAKVVSIDYKGAK